MIEVALLGLAAGVLSGMFGVGGGILFVPALTVGAGLSQVDAEATSLLAIIPVAALGAWRQYRYGNVRVRDAVVIGVLSAGGAVGGAALAHAVPEHGLRIAFAALLVAVAVQMARNALAAGRE